MNKTTNTIFFINEYTGSLLSIWWHNRIPKDEASEQETTVNSKESINAQVI